MQWCAQPGDVEDCLIYRIEPFLCFVVESKQLWRKEVLLQSGLHCVAWLAAQDTDLSTAFLLQT
jgi:hypothetical protein